LVFSPNAGATQAFDMLISGASMSGVENSYSFGLAGSPVAEVYGEGNSTNSGVQNTSFIIHAGLTLDPSGVTATAQLLGSRPFYSNYQASPANWYLPKLSTSTGRVYYLKNNGGVVTLIPSGVDKLFSTGLVNSFNIDSGEAFIVGNDGTNWGIM